MNDTCRACHSKTIDKLIQKFDPSPEMRNRFISSSEAILNNKAELSNPKLATLIFRNARIILDQEDLYQKEKHRANTVMLKMYASLKELSKKSSNPFQSAAKMAVAGNIIDYGAHTASNDVEGQISTMINYPLSIDESEQLKNEVQKATNILYLGDNAGEIVCDKLLIETMNHPNITYVTRGSSVINDITMKDAADVGMTEVCHVISNGYDAPSTIIENCSEEFKKAYAQADLIISKGQGNFEGLMDDPHPNLYFLLIAKCKPIAQLLGVEEGSMLITKKKH